MNIRKYVAGKVTIPLPGETWVMKERKTPDVCLETVADASPYVLLDLANTKYLSAKARSG